MPTKKKTIKTEKRKKVNWQQILVIIFGLLFIISFILGSVARF